jgi:hypothetical protein
MLNMPPVEDLALFYASFHSVVPITL